MKKIILFLLLFPALLAAQNAPDYQYLVEYKGDGLHDLIVYDQSRPQDEYIQARIYPSLDSTTLRNKLFLEKKQAINTKAQRSALTFLDDQRISRIDAQLDALGLNTYNQWTETIVASQGTFNGLYNYRVFGTATNLDIKIEGLLITNQANDSQIGSLSGPLAEKLVNITTATGTITLQQLPSGQWVGIDPQGRVALLTKTGDLPETP